MRVLKRPRPVDESNLGDGGFCVNGLNPMIATIPVREYLLFAPEIVLVGSLVVEITGVFNCDLISLRGLVFPIALLENLSGDTHCV